MLVLEKSGTEHVGGQEGVSLVAGAESTAEGHVLCGKRYGKGTTVRRSVTLRSSGGQRRGGQKTPKFQPQSLYRDHRDWLTISRIHLLAVSTAEKNKSLLMAIKA